MVVIHAIGCKAVPSDVSSWSLGFDPWRVVFLTSSICYHTPQFITEAETTGLHEVE